MSKEVIHVYLMPGMAANPKIFEYIQLPEDQFELHWLEWMLPDYADETIQDYAKRMAKFVKYDNSVLLGVSFGGLLVQEMSNFLNLRKLIVVSSVRSNQELPRRLKLMRKTKLYKVLPTQLASNIDLLAKFAFGKTITKRVELYKKYLSVSDKRYLDWAIKEVVCWEQTEHNQNAIHIHGDNDIVFPIKYIKDCIVVKGGTHIMIINKYKWFNKNLPKLILS